MANPLNKDEVRDYWAKQASIHGQSYKASWSDCEAIRMEICEVIKYLNDGDIVLDAGCANGYSTVQFAEKRKIQIVGIDFIPDMIQEANARLAKGEKNMLGEIRFDRGDITSLQLPMNSFDKVIVTRVLINLNTWEMQLHALTECARVLKLGGLLLLSEATIQGWEKLNSFRREWGLDNIPMPSFNVYLDEEKVIKEAPAELELKDVVNFSSTYYIGTRLIKPLIAKALDANIDIANPDMHWNKWMASLPAAGDYGTQKLFIFQKV